MGRSVVAADQVDHGGQADGDCTSQQDQEDKTTGWHLHPYASLTTVDIHVSQDIEGAAPNDASGRPSSSSEAHRNASHEFMTAVCLALADGDDVIEVGSTSIRPLEIFLTVNRIMSQDTFLWYSVPM